MKKQPSGCLCGVFEQWAVQIVATGNQAVL